MMEQTGIYIVKIDDKELKPVRITNDEADEGVPVWWSSDCFNKKTGFD